MSEVHQEKRTGGISSWSVNRPVGTFSIALMVMILGVLFFGRLPVSLLPEVDFPHIRVVVNYPGVTPEVIEEQLTRVLERNLSATENLSEIHGRASEGRTYIEMYFEPGTNIDIALQDAARQLERARAELPQGIDPPRLMKMDPSQSPIFELAFSSSVRSSIELRDWIDQRLLPQLLTVPGTGTIEVAGGKEREIDVVVDPERMRSFRLTLPLISQTIAARNVDIAAGNITSDAYDVLARTENRYQDARQVANTLISIPGSNHRVRLSDIATVTDSHREQRLFARHNGQDAVQVTIMKQPDANTVEVIRGLERTLQNLEDTGFITPDIHFEVIRNESFFIIASIRAVATAAILGGLLAMLVILLFLGSLRRALIIGITLPVAITATFLLMSLSGLSLNVLSLGGLALGVGLLLDNGLVMLENIFRHQVQLKKDPDDASHEGAAEVRSAIVAGTMTNLAAVAPFLLLTGLAALIFRELILTISFAILTSLAAALTLVPSLAALAAKVKQRSRLDSTRLIRAFQRGLENISQSYRKFIPKAIRWRYMVLLLASAALALSVFLLLRIGTEFLPPVDDGRITMRFVLPLGTAPEPTNEVAAMLEEKIEEMPHVETVYATAGGYFRGGQLSIRGGMIDMVVQLVPLSERRGYPAERWVSEFSGIVREMGLPFVQQRIRGPRIEGLQTTLIEDDISIGVVGEELDVLNNTARQILEEIRNLPGIGSVQVGRDEQIPQVVIRLDEERAADMGISVEDAGNIIRTSVDGMVPTRYVTGGFEYNIRVRFPRSVTGSVNTLGDIPLFDAQGRHINLSSIASFEDVLGPAHIERLNQIRIVRVNATVNLAEATVGQVNEQVRQALGDFDLPDGYSLIFAGAAEQIEETNRSMRLAIILAVVFVLLVMAVQYERLSSPLVIITSIPFMITGVALVLWLTGFSLSAPVLLGVIFLTGILVNNAILLVDFADRFRHSEQKSAAEAMAEAGAVRLRPVLMTNLTTIFGMLPLALGLGEGSELMQPLALTVIGGITIGTLFNLMMVPGIYVIFDQGKQFISRKLFSSDRQG
jgi:hydrophobe/amphiphile efflux-1 (HAE1) family protein